MIITLLVYFMAGYAHFVPVSSIDECISQGQQLIASGAINYYQCARVHEVR